MRTVTVKGVADNLSDGDQDYAIVLTGDSSSTDLRFRNVDPADVSVRNLDYTTKGGFYVSQISGDTDENLNTAFFTVSLSSAPSSDNVTITMATSDSGDGSISNVTGGTGMMTTASLVFTSSDWNSVRTVTVTGVADNLSDGDQDYAIVLTGDSSSTDLRFRNVDPADVSVRNLDYTTKGGFYVSQISGDTDENLNTAFFTVSLSSAPSSDNVTITMATSDHEGVISECYSEGTGLLRTTASLVFTSSELELGADGDGDRCGGQLIGRRPGLRDCVDGRQFQSDLRFANVDPADVSVRNLDYTTKGGFYVSQISGDTDENRNTAFFTVSLSSAPDSDNVTITMATSDSGDGFDQRHERRSGLLRTTLTVFTSSNWNSVRTVTVTGVADNLSDGDQDYAIVLTGDNQVRIFASGTWILPDVSVRNLDYTTKGGFYVSQISGDTDENRSTAYFTVSLSSAPDDGDNSTTNDNVTITLSSSDTSEGTISSSDSSLTFTAANWNSVRTVTVTGVADNLSDGDQSYTIVLTGDNQTSDLRFANVDPPDVSVRNLDYTTKGGSRSTSLRSQEDTDENRSTAFFTVSLSSAPDDGDNVTITMTMSDSRSRFSSSDTSGGAEDNFFGFIADVHGG